MTPGLLAYRALIALLLPVLALRLRGRGGLHLADRLCLGPGPARPAGRLLWLHGASNGEIASARAIATAALARDPHLTVLVSANTAGGRALAASWGPARVIAALAPFDSRGATRRFLRRWRPEGLVIVENELWPNRLDLCARQGIPVAVLGARMSPRSARFWGRFPGLARRMLGSLAWLSAQDAASRERFLACGLPADRVGPVVTLKSAPDLGGAETEAGTLPWPAAQTLLAASTHEGEDAMVLDAFVAARRSRPALRLILAPRHPARAAAIAPLIAARGLAFATRSQGETPGPDIPVFLADSLGEMARWYRAAGMTFVGGSLTEVGGHTPYEPVAAGSAVLHGPHVANHAAAYAALDAAGAATVVADAGALAAAVLAFADPAAQAEAARRARLALPAEDAAPAIAAALDHVLKGTPGAVHP